MATLFLIHYLVEWNKIDPTNTNIMKAIVRKGYFTPRLEFTTLHPNVTTLKDTTTTTTTTVSEGGPPPQVLLRVHAAAINPIDYKIMPVAKLAHTVVGFDVSGVVVSATGNSDLQVGDRVFGQADRGSLAEYVTAQDDCLARVPESWTMVEAAALPVAYVVAYQNLHQLTEQSELLIIGASGGCGIAALQIAHALKVRRIVAICSAKNEALVREHGATEVVDYTDRDALAKFWNSFSSDPTLDCVYDAASFSGGGEDYTTVARTLLKPPGTYVQLNASFAGRAKQHMARLSKSSTSTIMPLVSHSMTRQSLEGVTRLLDQTGVKPIVITQPFDETGFQQGFDMLKSRRTKGKIVYEVYNETEK